MSAFCQQSSFTCILLLAYENKQNKTKQRNQKQKQNKTTQNKTKSKTKSKSKTKTKKKTQKTAVKVKAKNNRDFFLKQLFHFRMHDAWLDFCVVFQVILISHIVFYNI